jgi:hypothetical protein
MWPSPDKFYKRGSQEKSLSYSWIFSNFPAHVMKRDFVLASYPRDLVFPSHRFHPVAVTMPIGV